MQVLKKRCHCEPVSTLAWQSVPLRTGRFHRNAQKIATFGIRISGLALSICAARCLHKRKRLPSRCGRLTPPQAALPCGPRRFAPRNDSAGRNPIIKMSVLTKTDSHNFSYYTAAAWEMQGARRLFCCFLVPGSPGVHAFARRPEIMAEAAWRRTRCCGTAAG